MHYSLLCFTSPSLIFGKYSPKLQFSIQLIDDQFKLNLQVAQTLSFKYIFLIFKFTLLEKLE